MFCVAILRPLLDIMRPLLPNNFPKDSEYLKFLDIQLWEVGGERHLNGTLKSEQTHTRKNQRIESMGPEGQCFEN